MSSGRDSAVHSCGPGPLFVCGNDRYLTRDRFVLAIRSALTMAGINASLYNWAQLPDWGGHNCGTERDLRLPNQDDGAMGEQRIHYIHLGRFYVRWQVPLSGPETLLTVVSLHSRDVNH